MPRLDQFLDDRRADEAGCASNEDTHEILQINDEWRLLSAHNLSG
jgi:hypothetical protein